MTAKACPIHPHHCTQSEALLFHATHAQNRSAEYFLQLDADRPRDVGFLLDLAQQVAGWISRSRTIRLVERVDHVQAVDTGVCVEVFRIQAGNSNFQTSRDDHRIPK